MDGMERGNSSQIGILFGVYVFLTPGCKHRSVSWQAMKGGQI